MGPAQFSCLLDAWARSKEGPCENGGRSGIPRALSVTEGRSGYRGH